MKVKNAHKDHRKFRISVITFDNYGTITYSNNIYGE